MDETELKNIIEALLLSSLEPLSTDRLLSVFDEWEKPTLKQIHDILRHLQEEYQSRSLELIEVASGYRLQTKACYGSWVARLQIEKPAKYSRALVETLAIIAYKQPVTRADIEEIRGVAVTSQIIKTLIEREWIRVAGHKDVPGKPAVFVTTKEFLNYFNLQYLHELPMLPEISEIPAAIESVNSQIVESAKEECVS